MCRTFFTIFLICIVSCYSYAAKLEVEHANWSVFVDQEKGEKFCYIVGAASESSGSIKEKRHPFITITNFTDRKDEFSVSSGYVYKEKNIELKIDKNIFSLSANQDSAWPKTIEDDAKIIKLLQSAKKIIVIDQTNSMDTYSLVGFNKAFKAMKKVCKWKSFN